MKYWNLEKLIALLQLYYEQTSFLCWLVQGFDVSAWVKSSKNCCTYSKVPLRNTVQYVFTKAQIAKCTKSAMQQDKVVQGLINRGGN